MAALALALCLGCVFVLVYRDCRRWPELSPGLWIAFIWVLYFMSRALSAWVPRTGLPDIDDKLQAFAEGNPFERNFQLLMILIGSVELARRRLDWKPILRDNRALILLIMFCGLSITWSDSPFVSFRRWVKNAGPVVAALIIFTERDPLHALTAVFRRCAYVLLPVSLVLIVFYPQYGITGYVSGLVQEYQYTGVTTNKNQLGRLSMISCFFLVASFPLLWRTRERHRWPEVFILLSFILLSLYLLYKSNSATAYVCLFIVLVTYLGLGTSVLRQHAGRVVAFALVFVVLFLVAEVSFGVIDRVLVLLGRDPTFTGRTRLWQDLLSVGTNPLIGVGFSTFWEGERARTLWETYSSSIHQAHNGYLEVYLEVGLIGLGLLLWVILSACGKGLRAVSFASLEARCALSLLAVVVAYNCTEASFDGSGVILLLLIAAGGFPSRPRAGQVEEEAISDAVRPPPVKEGPRRLLPGPVAGRRSPALRPKRIFQSVKAERAGRMAENVRL